MKFKGKFLRGFSMFLCQSMIFYVIIIVESCGSGIVLPESKKKGKKRDAAAVAAKKAALADFKIEYAKSSKSTCKGCEQKIMKEEVRTGISCMNTVLQ